MTETATKARTWRIGLFAVMGSLTVLTWHAPVAMAEEAAAAAAAEEEKMTFLELLAKGRWFMLPIGLCSLLAVTIIIERLVALRRRTIIPPGFLPGLKKVLQDPQRDRQRAAEYCQRHDCPTARVVAVGIRKMPQGIDSVEQGIEDAGANEVAKLRRNLRMLYGVAAVAPMIGLLGTVWGMIQAFQVAAIGGLGGGAEGLAAGIYEALVTTFAGLSVAIPVLVFYYFFQGRIERIISEVNDVCESFMEHYLAREEGGVHSAAASTSATPSREDEREQGDAGAPVPSPV